MKTLILILISASCLGQINPLTGTPTKVTFTNPTNINWGSSTMTWTFVHMKFSPTLNDNYQIEDFVKEHYTIEEYDKFVKSARVDSAMIKRANCTYINVHVRIRDQTKNYTFSEFRELIWPTPKRRPRYVRS